MSAISYTSIIKKAWHITWRNKYLWWFGFFIALTETGMMIFNLPDDKQNLADGGKIIDFISSHLAVIIWTAVSVLIIYIFLLVLSIIARGGLIKSAGKIFQGEKTDFLSGMKAGRKYFWKILLIGVFASVLFLFSLLVLLVPVSFFMINQIYFTALLLSLLAFIIAIPLFILIFFLKTYGYIYAVLSDLGAVQSLENAYYLLRKNLRVSILMLLITSLLEIIAVILTGITTLPFIIILAVTGGALFLILGKTGIIIAAGLAAIVSIIISLAIFSFFKTFKETLWVLFFYEIARPKVEEKIAEPAVAIKSAPDPAECT